MRVRGVRGERERRERRGRGEGEGRERERVRVRVRERERERRVRERGRERERGRGREREREVESESEREIFQKSLGFHTYSDCNHLFGISVCSDLWTIAVFPKSKSLLQLHFSCNPKNTHKVLRINDHN